MASTMALGPAITATRAALVASVSLTGYVGARVYPDSEGDAPQKPRYPYVQVESGGETPFNTMGAGVDALKWGSVARVNVRVGSDSRSDAQVNTVSGLVKQALDGQTLTVSGYAHATAEFVDVTPMRDFVGGQTIREWVLAFDVTVHQ
jgi:hypothetical protein